MKPSTTTRFPPALAVVCLIFLSAPLFASLYVENPVSLYENGDNLRANVVILAFYAVPLILAAFILARHVLAIPLFIAESALLIFHAIMQAEHFDLPMQALRYFLLGLMLVLGILILNKDTLYPFLNCGKRWWRRSERLSANHPMYLRLKDDQAHITVMLQDCSLNGVGMTGNLETIKALMDRMTGDQALLVGFKNADGYVEAAGDIVWTRDTGSLRQVGLDVENRHFMEDLLRQLDLMGTETSPWLAWVHRQWTHTGIRRGTLVAWMAILCVNYVTPACAPEVPLAAKQHQRPLQEEPACSPDSRQAEPTLEACRPTGENPPAH